MKKGRNIITSIILICMVVAIMQILPCHNNEMAFASDYASQFVKTDKIIDTDVKFHLIYESKLPYRAVNSFDIDNGETITLKNVTIAEDAIIYVPKNSTLIIEGIVNNYGQINVDGKMIINPLAVLRGEKIYDDLDITFTKPKTVGGVKIGSSGLVFVSENAKHIVKNAGLIENNGTYILEGKLVTNGVFLNNNYCDISSNGIMSLNALESQFDEDILEPCSNSLPLYIQTKNSDISCMGTIEFNSKPGYVQIPKLVGTTYINFAEKCNSIIYN